MLTITLKNYRAFSDADPLVMEFGSQFTALVGPNNSGKSSLLLAIYELRNLWLNLQGAGIANIINGAIASPGSYLDVGDPLEVFNNSNSRPITIEIGVSQDPNRDESNVCVSRLVLTCERDSPFSWRGIAFAGDQRIQRSQQGVKWEPITKVLQNTLSGVPTPASEMSEAVSLLAGTLYIGPFRSVIGQITANYYDLEIGAAFITIWNIWKSGTNKSQNNAIGSITDNIRDIFKFKQLEISAQAGGGGLHVRVDGKPYRLAELGAGLAQFIIAFANAAIKNPQLILIDEPELHLHPSLQLSFLTALGSYAPKGVLFATHSLGLARSVADRIYTLRRVEGNSVARKFEQTAGYVEFLGEMSFNAFMELGYDSILLVEGVNDVRTVQQFLRLLGKDNRVVVFPLHGNELAAGGREVELAEIRRLSARLFALVDSERTSSGDAPDSSRIAFAEVCKKLGIDVCVTERRAIENYLSDRAVKEVFGAQYSALKPYEQPRDVKPSWGKDASWRAAQRMTKSELGETDVYEFLSRI